MSDYMNIDQWVVEIGSPGGKMEKYPVTSGCSHDNYYLPDVADVVDLKPLGGLRNISVKITEVLKEAKMCRGTYLVTDNTKSIFGRKWKLGEEIPVEFSIGRILFIYKRDVE